ncbi:hypothetical protein GCK72_019074 [Caenorhabditis remanei]|uniref:Uncharacterized protein n=1 Tax=Caenorhabditis remanei TaxID=31234 RepID=A0A6A5GDM2_CAERE|nr:hypothetical protein GCK72_019074 [Caenorhabditis remanei]KAF1752519.1 hypothetical protein GCK72_019074 [Caenorhabditis remanei]
MHLKLYILLIISPVLIWTCGSDIAGTSSKSAEFGISFFAPLAYTYPPADVDLVPGQSLTLELANRRVKTDLDLAISKGLTANQIYLYIPPTLNFTFTPPSVQIADGEVCVTDNTYIQISGTVIYKCSIGNSGASTNIPVSGATGAPTNAPVSGATDVTESPVTDSTASSTSVPSTNTPPELVDNDRDNFHALPRRRASSGVRAHPFDQSMTVIATTSQPLYENQWNKIARSVQQALEDKKLLFNDDIQVLLL